MTKPIALLAALLLAPSPAAAQVDPPRDAVNVEAARRTMTSRLEAAGAGHVRSLRYEDDHPFSAHRIALAEELVNWLGGQCTAVQIAGRR